MANQKAETLLNLALETPLAERVQSGNLNVGYSVTARTWEFIVKYNGSLREVAEAFPGMEIVMAPLSLSVSCHIGPGALAIACSKKVPELA